MLALFRSRDHEVIVLEDHHPIGGREGADYHSGAAAVHGVGAGLRAGDNLARGAEWLCRLVMLGFMSVSSLIDVDRRHSDGLAFSVGE